MVENWLVVRHLFPLVLVIRSSVLLASVGIVCRVDSCKRALFGMRLGGLGYASWNCGCSTRELCHVWQITVLVYIWIIVKEKCSVYKMIIFTFSNRSRLYLRRNEHSCSNLFTNENNISNYIIIFNSYSCSLLLRGEQIIFRPLLLPFYFWFLLPQGQG